MLPGSGKHWQKPTVYWNYLHAWDDSSQILWALYGDERDHSVNTSKVAWLVAKVQSSMAHHIQHWPAKQTGSLIFLQGNKIFNKSQVISRYKCYET